tara:strand:+ start:50 stop:364 length:315 start_codon:yes stop_codon:yes gene_type:complete
MKTTSRSSCGKKPKSLWKGIALLALGLSFLAIAWIWTDRIIAHRGPSVWRILMGAEFTPTGLSLEIQLKVLFGPLIFWASGIFTVLWGAAVCIFRVLHGLAATS